jgi:predicted outer membrane repeat protein
MSRRPYIEAIEPRLLYSADLAAAVGGQSLQPLRTFEQGRLDTLELQAAAQQATPRVEIALVDRSVPDAAQLIADLRAQQQAGRRIEIVTLGEQEDGIARLTELLRGRSDVGAVHVLGHGADGVVQLGGVRLDAATLLARAGEVATWGAALADDADVLLYGCDVAASEKGRQLIADLAALTGADVAASDDATGAAALGGNWTLEARTGAVEAALAPSEQARQAWSGLLQEFVVTRFDDTTEEGSLRWAINQASSKPGDHLIRLAAGTYLISISGSGSPNNGDFDITGSGRLQIVGAGAGATTIEIASQAASRVFDVSSGASLELSGLTLKGASGSASGSGGVIRVQGGGSLTMTDSVIDGGRSKDDGGALYIASSATAALQRVEIRNAQASDSNSDGGAIYNAGSLTLIDSTLAGNRSGGDGGALYQAVSSGTLTLKNVTLSGNTAADKGGAIYS